MHEHPSSGSAPEASASSSPADRVADSPADRVAASPADRVADSAADVCVVLPTIREFECLRAYVANARVHGFDTDRLFFVLVTEDFCDTEAMRAMLDDLDVAGAVFDESAREAWLESRDVGGYDHLVPAASHAQTSFGLLFMWAHPGFEYGVFIDDDTLPHDEWDYFGRHLANLHREGPMTTVRSDERWVNVLYQNHDEHGLYPRGYPYSSMDETVETGVRRVSDVVASQGLWTNVPDLDAVRILMDGDMEGQAQTRTSKDDFGDDFVADPGQYLTVCSMNLAFRREVIPAFYQLPMDDNDWDVGRFDDIWSGVFLKRAADLLGDEIVTGAPLCEHNKAPRPTFDDLSNEVPGLELNEHLWEVVDDVSPTAGAREAATEGVAAADGGTTTDGACAHDGASAHDGGAATDGVGAHDGVAPAAAYAAVFRAIADRLAEGDFSDWTNGAFLNHCGAYMQDWLDCLDDLAPATATPEPIPADD